MKGSSRSFAPRKSVFLFPIRLIAGLSEACPAVRRLFAIPVLYTPLLGAASMSNNIARELTSIIVPAWNQLQFTQQCLAALEEHTRPAWELIVIDNGSADGTAAYLAGVRDMASVPEADCL